MRKLLVLLLLLIPTVAFGQVSVYPPSTTTYPSTPPSNVPGTRWVPLYSNPDGALYVDFLDAPSFVLGAGSATIGGVTQVGTWNVGITGTPTFTVGNSTLAVTGTFWQTTQPISGTVTVNAGTNLNTSALTLDSHTTNVQSAPGTSQTTAITVQGNASGVPVPISGTAVSVPKNGTFTNYSGSISSGGTSQQIVGSVSSRTYFLIVNTSYSDTLYVNFTSAATALSEPLPPGWSIQSTPSFCTTEAINIFGVTTGDTYFAEVN